jgi:hypothetical protein
MTDLEHEVRETLSAPPDYAPRNLDFNQIMVAGVRLRRRRKIVTGAVAAVAAVALIGGAQVTGLLGQGAPQPVNPPAATVSPAPPPKIFDNTNGLKGPLGDPIGTGVRTHNQLELVIFGVSGKTVGLENTYAFAIGERLADGDVTEWASINEDPDVAKNTAPGFHATQYATEMSDGDVLPAFGYYVGTPAKITAKYEGKTVTAKTAIWSYDTSVTVFWFDPVDAPTDALGRPHAYDAAGNELPAGNNKVQGVI